MTNFQNIAAIRPQQFRELCDLTERLLHEPDRVQWSVQGLGMMRCYLNNDKSLRLHLWDSSLKYVKDAGTHTHPWDFLSCILSGELRNTRYLCSMNGWGHVSMNRILVQCGKDGCVKGEPEEASLVAKPVEIYRPGNFYSQTKDEIHSSDADDGTVSLIGRTFHEDTEHAYVFYPIGSPYTSAETRDATPEEIARVTARARDKWHWK